VVIQYIFPVLVFCAKKNLANLVADEFLFGQTNVENATKTMYVHRTTKRVTPNSVHIAWQV
jgi:hypothetical protein